MCVREREGEGGVELIESIGKTEGKGGGLAVRPAWPLAVKQDHGTVRKLQNESAGQQESWFLL